MKTRKNKCIAKYIVTLCLTLLVLTGTGIKSFAGDINGEEARVIAAASGVFYYNNEAYAAYPSYISQLSGYLAQDGVDLTAAQADTAISQIYSSIGQGVSEGYLYKIGEVEDEETTEESTTEEPFVSDKPPIMIIPDTTETAGNTNENGNQADGNQTDDQTGANSQNDDAFAGHTVEDEKKDSDTIKQVDEEEATGSITYDVETHTIVYTDTDNNTVTELPSIAKPLDVTGYVHTAYIVFLLMLAVILVLIVGLYLGKCFPWQRKKRNRKTARYYVNHKMRGRYRKVAGNIFTVFIAVHVLTGVVLLGMGASMFRTNFIIDNLTSSGYYRYIYDDMRSSVQRQLAKEGEEVADKLLAEIGYDAFLNASKKQVQNSLAGIETTYDVEELQKKLMAVDCGLEQDQQEMAVNVVIGNMQTYTMDMVGSSIYGVEQGYKYFAKHTIIIMAINMILMMVVAVLMDRYRHRGVRFTARGVIAGSIIGMIGAGIMYVLKPYEKIHMQPASLCLFVRDYLQHAMVIMAAIACIAVLAGVFLYVLVGVVRKIQMEDD